jgi:NAD+ synthase (glutamine-hydrolysing)
MPDGIKISEVSLSPKADWRMPSDASLNWWMKIIEQL